MRRLRALVVAGSRPRRLALGGAALALLSSVVVLSTVFSVSCPDGTECVTLGDIRRGAPLPAADRVLDRNGALLAEVGGPLRRALPRERIPDLVADAFVVVEDRRFWSHEGVDAWGVLRAAIRNLRSGGLEEGASTIPMQLVRTLWSESLRDVGPWRRKVIEARTAPRLIAELGHERVLTLYLNSIYLGNGLYGVERAARHYFGVGVDSLEVHQVATLVGITRSPELYEPRRHPDRARRVRDVVLTRMAAAGLITEREAEAAASLDLDLADIDDVARAARTRSHLTAAVRRELRRLAPGLPFGTGLEILTTIDPDVQREARTAVEAQVAAIEAGRFGPLEATPDSTAPLEAAAVALDPATGAVRAWIGGRDFTRSEFDRVEQARRQVGSLVKPFLVALALERGYGIIDMVSADTVPIPTDQGSWLPADHVPETRLPLREALVRSSNRAAAHLGTELGLEALSGVGVRVGLSGHVPAVPSSAIGAFDASLLEMTSAYSAFGNGGARPEPYLVERVRAADGAMTWERSAAAAPDRIMDEATAFTVLDALRAVVDRGTGAAVRAVGYRRPAAGKTGTTNDGRDAWFIGLTPDLVAGVWIGFDTPGAIVEDRGGGALAAPAWADWMSRLEHVAPHRGAWIPPISVERIRYDPLTGAVVAPHCGVASRRAYHDAWVVAGRYDRSTCPGTGVLGWLERLWQAVASEEPDSVRRRPPRR